jgi:hypothetical protein
MERRVISLQPDGSMVSKRRVLPVAQSGAEVLALGARMLEPEILNIRAWALDAVDDSASGVWHIETLVDGICGVRPPMRATALECPKERTRVACSFEPSTGELVAASTVLVSQERCWQVSPSAELAASGSADDLDPEWVAAAVGFDCFGGGGGGDGSTTPTKTGGETLSLCLDCGVELRGEPGLLVLTIRSGKGARNGYDQVTVRRSWVGGSAFTEVGVVEDTTGDEWPDDAAGDLLDELEQHGPEDQGKHGH